MCGTSYESLRKLLEESPVAHKATRPLAPSARVNLALREGPARFSMEGGRSALLPGAGQDPDFTLTVPDGAVQRLVTLAGEDVGEFGIEFFKLVLERDPELRVRIRVDASAARLLAHGYLGVLALGGLKVSWWLLRIGVKNPLAAIERLRRR
jgi:hypothetical protein